MYLQKPNAFRPDAVTAFSTNRTGTPAHKRVDDHRPNESIDKPEFGATTGQEPAWHDR